MKMKNPLNIRANKGINLYINLQSRMNFASAKSVLHNTKPL